MVGDDGLLKLADFGCSKEMDGGDKGCLNSFKGTEFYMAPEILVNDFNNNKENYDGAKVDVFSLGVLLFSLIFNQHPFRKALRRDVCYRHIYEKNFDRFWSKIQNKLN